MFDGGVLIESWVSEGVVGEFVSGIVEEESDSAEAFCEFPDDEECGLNVIIM